MRLGCSATVAVVGIVFHSAYASVTVPHDMFLRERFDVSEARRFRTNSNWWVSCFFADIDNDGFEEVISTTVSQADRSGNASTFWTTKPDGRLHRISEAKLLATNFFFNTFHYSYYRMDLGGRNKYIIGLDMDAGFYKDDGVTMQTPTPDCFFGIGADNQLSVAQISPSLDSVFFAATTARVERIYAETFTGFGFKYEPRNEWFGYEFPKPVAKPMPPDGIDIFIANYMRDIKARTALSNDVQVYAIFLDADNNGGTDCYISSSVDKVNDETYLWSLYMNLDGRLQKAEARVASVSRREDLPVVEPMVVARKDAFCRVVRFDAPLTYVIMDDSKVKDGLIKKTITNLRTHSIEKLQCKEYFQR